MKKRRTKDDGRWAKRAFTLVELLLVVLIISILAGMVFPRLVGKSEQARKSVARADIEANIALALDMYELDNGAYPTTEQGLAALLSEPGGTPKPVNWNGPYLKKKPKDPWGRDYVYEYAGAQGGDYKLYSLGPDGIQGNDDITSWGDEKEK